MATPGMRIPKLGPNFRQVKPDVFFNEDTRVTVLKKDGKWVVQRPGRTGVYFNDYTGQMAEVLGPARPIVAPGEGRPPAPSARTGKADPNAAVPKTKNNQQTPKPAATRGQPPADDPTASADPLAPILERLGISLSGDIERIRKLVEANPAFVKLGRVPDAPTINAVATAKRLADIEYGGAIRETRRSSELLERQAPQNLADIRSWYDQVRGTLSTAKTDDQAAADAAVAAVEGGAADVMRSLGGGASEAAGAIGAAGVAEAGTLRALGLAQQNYNSGALGQLSMEKAGQLLRQQRGDQQRADQLAALLAEQERQRGNVTATREVDLRQQNFANSQAAFGQEMQTREFNQGLRQQRIQNLQSIPALEIAAATAGPEVAEAYASALSGGQRPESPGSIANRRVRVAADVRKRRGAAAEAISGAVAPQTVEDPATGEKITRPLTADQAIQRAVNIARSKGLDLRKPEVRQLLRETVRTWSGLKPWQLEQAWRRTGLVPLPSKK